MEKARPSPPTRPQMLVKERWEHMAVLTMGDSGLVGVGCLSEKGEGSLVK